MCIFLCMLTFISKIFTVFTKQSTFFASSVSLLSRIFVDVGCSPTSSFSLVRCSPPSSLFLHLLFDCFPQPALLRGFLVLGGVSLDRTPA